MGSRDLDEMQYGNGPQVWEAAGVPLRGTFANKVSQVLDEVERTLIEKNKAYGNSALDPVRIFSKSDAREQLRVRIDDKLSRFARGSEYPGDDTVTDLLGYLVLLKIASDV